MLIVFEGLVMCFILLITCVVGIANGPIGLVVLYEDDVQKRVVELGLIKKEQLRTQLIIASIAMFVPMVFLTPFMVYYINGAVGFLDAFWQMTAINLIMNVFDRFFIDWYWVGKKKAWEIPGTEDLKPYIPPKMIALKWMGTLVGTPAISAIVIGLCTLIL